jgi:hypothetical protein
MRRIGQAKAGLAADYAAQLARSAGKVVFFAKHVDVMDAAEEAPSLRRPRGELLHPHTPGERPVTAETGRGQQPDRQRAEAVESCGHCPAVAARTVQNSTRSSASVVAVPAGG